VPRVHAVVLLLVGVAACAQSLSRAPSLAPSAVPHEAPSAVPHEAPTTPSPSAARALMTQAPPFARWFPSCAPSTSPTVGTTKTGTWIVYLFVAQMVVILGYCAYFKATRRPACEWCAPLAKAMAWACPDKKVAADNGSAMRYPHPGPGVTPLRHGDVALS